MHMAQEHNHKISQNQYIITALVVSLVAKSTHAVKTSTERDNVEIQMGQKQYLPHESITLLS